MKFKIALLCIASSGLAACAPPMPYNTMPAPPQNVEPSTPFDSVALDQGMQPGHAIVKGQAFSKTVGGDVKLAAGNVVTLWPKTPYSAECGGLMLSRLPTTCLDQLSKYARTTRADGNGHFEFADLQPGSYVVWTLITWGVPTGYGLETTGGVVLSVVEVKSDTDVLSVVVN